MSRRLLSCLCATLIAVPAFAGEINVPTARGAADVPHNPDRVVVLDVAAADTIDALGVEIDGTLEFLYVDYLDELQKSAADVGTFFEPDIEAIHALKPELIVLGGRNSDQLKDMSRLAPTVDMTIGLDTVDEAFLRLETYGKIFGREEAAADLKSELETALAEAKAAAKGKGSALIVMTNGPKISVYGRSGRFGWLHDVVGLEESALEVSASNHGESISFEFIKEKNPDWLIVIDRLAAIGRPSEGSAATLDNVLVHDTTAWSKGQVIYLNGADSYIANGGVQATLRILKQVTTALNGG